MDTTSNSSTLLLSSVTGFFQKHKRYRDTLYEIIEGTSPVSLRLMDWFVTHYARSKNVLFWVDDETHMLYEKTSAASAGRLRKFHLYYEYRAQLKAYTKLYFDPFRRHGRITFVLDPTSNRKVETTVGQLNFFRWVLQNQILEYVQAHLNDIEDDMSSAQKKKTSGDGDADAAGANNARGAEADAAKAAESSKGKKKKCVGRGGHIPASPGHGVINAHCRVRFD